MIALVRFAVPPAKVTFAPSTVGAGAATALERDGELLPFAACVLLLFQVTIYFFRKVMTGEFTCCAGVQVLIVRG